MGGGYGIPQASRFCQALLIGQMTLYDEENAMEGGARQYLDPKNVDGDGETAVLFANSNRINVARRCYAVFSQGFPHSSLGKLWWRVRGRHPPNSH